MKTNKKQCYRHGEIAFKVIGKLPEGLTKSKNKEFLKGSHGHPHTYNKGEFYPKVESENIFGYFVAKNTTLFHLEHGDKKDGELMSAKLPDGIYRLRRGVEVVNKALKQIID
jgi:hypothetical protein